MFVPDVCAVSPIHNSIPTIVVLRGEEIAPYLPDLIDLFLEVWKEPPFLYEGSFQEYMEWFKLYLTEDAIVSLLFDGPKLIGAVTGVPLTAMEEKYQRAFANEAGPVYYLGEEVLLPAYRGQKLGKWLFNGFIEEIPRSYRTLAFIRMEETVSPPLDAVLKKMGCIEHKDRIIEASWREIGSLDEVPHRMVSWTYPLD